MDSSLYVFYMIFSFFSFFIYSHLLYNLYKIFINYRILCNNLNIALYICIKIILWTSWMIFFFIKRRLLSQINLLAKYIRALYVPYFKITTNYTTDTNTLRSTRNNNHIKQYLKTTTSVFTKQNKTIYQPIYCFVICILYTLFNARAILF